MSGGHFDYGYFRIYQFADELRQDIVANDETYRFDDGTLEKLIDAESFIRQAGELAKEIEYLYSGDTGEDFFRDQYDKIMRDE